MGDSPAAILHNTAGTAIATATTTPGASDNALVVRNIPSGTQPISGAVNQGTAGSAAWPISPELIGSGSSYPDIYDAYPNTAAGDPDVAYIDVGGNLKVRGSTLTDEGSLRDDFPGNALDTTITGTATFTAGSRNVVGVGTLFTTELSRYYKVRRTGDASYYSGRIAKIIDDTHLLLMTPYTGTTGTSAPIKAVWIQHIGTGGSIAVASSELTVASGTTNGQNTYIFRHVDYGPLILNLYGYASQRIANQELRFGLADNDINSVQYAYIVFDGTDNTKLKLRTAGNTGDIETSAAVTLPNAGTTAGKHWYRIELTLEAVSLYVDNIFVVQNRLHLPNAYTAMGMMLGCFNTATPATSTSLIADVIVINNLNILQVGGAAANIPLNVSIGCNDGTGFYRQSTVKNTTPLQNDYGQITRPIKEKAATSAVTSVTAASADTVLLAANANRLGAMVHNDSSAILYLKLGTGASATSFTVKMAKDAYYEVPFDYTGAINGYWASVNGSARVTEVSA